MIKTQGSTIVHKILPLLLLAFTVSGCFDDDEIVFQDQLLEWEPPNRATNELSMNISLEVDEVEDRSFSLRMQYAGPHVSEVLFGEFEVVEDQTTAIEGEHFSIDGDKTLNIPANSSQSEAVEVQIHSSAVAQGESLSIVLRITQASSVPPMENYKDFLIRISKDEPPSLEPIQVRLDRPGYNASPNMLDVINAERHSRNQARADESLQAQTDFGLWRSSSTELTMMLPTADDRLSGFGSGRVIIDEWVNKNDGVLMKLPASQENQDLFDSLETSEDILVAYEAAEEELDQLGLDVEDHGPGRYIQWIASGELIFFHSTDRNIYMVALVGGADGDSGEGYADLNIKRIVHSDD